MGKVYAKLEFTLTFKPNNALEHLFHRLVPYKLRFLYFPPTRVYLWYFFSFLLFNFSVSYYGRLHVTWLRGIELRHDWPWLKLLGGDSRREPQLIRWKWTNGKQEMKSTKHFNYYLLISHSKNEKNQNIFENTWKISAWIWKTEKLEPHCYQPVKNMGRQNLEANVSELR